MTDLEIEKLTNDWFPELPKAHEKSVVLGGGLVLFPCADPEKTAEVLSKYVQQIVQRAHRAGRRAGKEEIRKDRKSTRLNPVTNEHLVCSLLIEKKKQKITRIKQRIT